MAFPDAGFRTVLTRPPGHGRQRGHDLVERHPGGLQHVDDRRAQLGLTPRCAVPGRSARVAEPGATDAIERYGIRSGIVTARDFDRAHPGWCEYLAGLRGTNDRHDWTYRFCVTRRQALAGPAVVATFGCFSYASLSDNRIRLHFQNGEPDGHRPLGIERQGHRLADLAALFHHVKRTVRQPLTVVGASWLYNLDAYRRLFPRSYLATAHVILGRFQHLPLWGQFVNRLGEIEETRAQQFLERLGRQSSLVDVDRCFPFQVLRVEGSVLDFYDFYGI